MADAKGGKGRVAVFARCRPMVEREFGERPCVVMDENAGVVNLELDDGDAVDRVLAGGSAAPKYTHKQYSFDAVFGGDSEQKDVFDAVGKPVLKDVLSGYNGSILAYGQTGAGKTHSLLNAGGRNGSEPQEAGLLPRVVANLFVAIGGDLKNTYDVQAAMMQIYNEQVDDLLVDNHEAGQNLTVTTGSVVRGLTWVQCKSPDELLNCFTKGRNNLVYAETKMNKASSRSHAVFQIKVVKRPRATEGGKDGKAVQMKATMGKLTVVDLAGSERVKKSGVAGKELKEAANINASLLAFGNVVSALAEKKKFVPYRDSKLTRILEDSVGGNCKTSLLVCCSPAAESGDETVSTLEFASRAMNIEITATVNETVVTVDAAKLAADLAGDGLSEAVKEKHKELQKLEGKLAEQMRSSQAELDKAKEAAKAAAAEEAKKAKDKEGLMNKWRTKAEEEGKRVKEVEAQLQARIKELEAQVVEAKDAKEVRAALAKAQRDAQEAVTKAEEKARGLEVQLKAARDEASKALADASSAADASAAALREELAAKADALAASEASTAKAEARVAALEADLAAAKEAAAAEAAAVKAEAAAKAREAAAEAEALRAEVAKAEAETTAAVGRENAAKEAAAEAAKAAEAKLAAALADAAEASERKLAALAKETTEREKASLAAHAEEVGSISAKLGTAEARVSTLETEGAAKAAAIKRLELARDGLSADLAAARATVETKACELVAQAEAARREATGAAEDYENALAAEEARGAARRQRVAWAFSAARALLERKKAEGEEKYATLKARFDARESREEDLAKVRELQAELKKEKKEHAGATQQARILKLDLENRNINDAVFGTETKANKGPAGMPKGAVKRTTMPAGVPARMAAAARMGVSVRH